MDHILQSDMFNNFSRTLVGTEIIILSFMLCIGYCTRIYTSIKKLLLGNELVATLNTVNETLS